MAPAAHARSGRWWRLLRHACYPPALARRAFDAGTRAAIEAAIGQAEALTRHGAELRFVVEATLEGAAMLAGQGPRERAIELFGRLGVWDTEHNNGVLIYLLLCEHAVEIVADRGIHARVGEAGWAPLCRDLEGALRERRYQAGALAAIEGVAALLGRHAPDSEPAAGRRNELPDAPTVL